MLGDWRRNSPSYSHQQNPHFLEEGLLRYWLLVYNSFPNEIVRRKDFLAGQVGEPKIQ